MNFTGGEGEATETSSLSPTEARLSAALSIARLGTFEWDLRTDAVNVDERSCEVLGLSSGLNLRAQDVFERIHPDDLERFTAEVRAAREQLSRLETEYRVVCFAGEVRTVASITDAVPGADGRAERIFGVLCDVTERRRSEQALRESEEAYRRTLQIETVGVIFLDLDGNITRANNAFLRMSGYTREEFARAPLRWDKLTPPDWMEATLQRRDQLMRTGTATPYEKQYFRKDGSRFWGLFAPRMLTDSEAVEFVLDITERKEAEEALRASEDKFRRAFRDAPVGLSLSNADGELLYVNAAYCRIVGYIEEELQKKVFTSLTYAEDIPRNRELHAQLLSGEIPSFVIEKRYVHKSGHLVWVRVTATVIRSDAGQPIQVVGIVENIQERKEAEAGLLQSREELVSFAHTVAHDLQTPLRGIGAYSELLSKKYSRSIDQTADQWLRFIVDGVRRMENLIRALLRYAEAGSRGTQSPVDTTTIVSALHAAMRPEIEAAGADVSYGLLPSVLADPVQVTQLFQNLIGNAIKYRKTDESPRIAISAQSRGDCWLFSVEDNGQGIDPEHSNRIFQPLQRLHGQSIPGSGIGLAICKKIVEQYGGQIWVESRSGLGSKFCFTLPRA